MNITELKKAYESLGSAIDTLEQEDTPVKRADVFQAMISVVQNCDTPTDPFSDPFSDVFLFMHVGHPDKVKTIPEEPDYDTRKLCEGLIDEEAKELQEAFEKHDIVETADAMADLIYVIIFAAHCYGIPLQRVWREVQRTNMAKFPDGKVLRRESDGKIMKPEGWEPPDIKAIIEGARG